MRQVTVDISDEDIDAALTQARNAADELHILEAEFHSQPGLEFLRLKLSNGHLLLIPREELGELKSATTAQAMDLKILTPGAAIWWPQLDEGLYLADFLQYRWKQTFHPVAA
jgi:hypothetical protein